MAITGWIWPILWPLLIAGLIVVYGLRGRTTRSGITVLAVVCFALFALWQALSAATAVQALALIEQPFPSPWLRLAVYLGLVALLFALAAAAGWQIHRRMFASEDVPGEGER